MLKICAQIVNLLILDKKEFSEAIYLFEMFV